MDGIAMTTERLRIIVDARYACDAYPGIGRVVSGMAQALAHHPDVAHLHLITNPRRVNTHCNRVIHNKKSAMHIQRETLQKGMAYTYSTIHII